MDSMILAGDIGGSTVRLALCEGRARDRLPPKVARVYEIPDALRHPLGFREILQRFCAETGGCRDVTRVCIGAAGPLRDDQSIAITNLSWVLEPQAIAAMFDSSPAVCLLNDLVAYGWGIATLSSDSFETIQSGDRTARGSQALIGIGTGLGMCHLHWDGERHVPIPAQGGHMDFAPRNLRQTQFLRRMLEESAPGRPISWEQVVSGMGFRTLLDALKHDHDDVASRQLLVECGDERHVGRMIQEAAEAPTPVPLARDIMHTFVDLCGAVAANLALMTIARGGVFLTGGIALKTRKWLREELRFHRAFCTHGRFANDLTQTPVHIVLDPLTAVKGAWLRAESLG